MHAVAEAPQTATGASRAVVIAEGLRVARGKRVLLDSVDLELRRGEIVVVLGPNGVGKSTMLSVLAGLLPKAGGTITLHGRVAAALQSPALARRSVRANLELAMGWWGVPRGQRAERVQSALALLHIEHLADRFADRLSGGEARRVHFARALALRSDALLLDEPFAGLDPPTRAELLGDTSAALRDINRATMVVVHDRAEAWALADRLIVLLDGRVAAQGTPHDVLDRPDSIDVARFLGFTGRVREADGGWRYVRPPQVALDADGPWQGRVTRRVPEEDGVLCEVALEEGELQVRSPYPGPRLDERVTLRIDGGVLFEGDERAPATSTSGARSAKDAPRSTSAGPGAAAPAPDPAGRQGRAKRAKPLWAPAKPADARDSTEDPPA
jgi:ABC-type sugar transport system ATPase subunit